MARLRALMRMTAVRLSAVYFLLFAICAVVLVFYVTATASGIVEDQSRATISEELNELAQVYRQGGIIGLVRTIDRRSRQPGASLYLVTDATGRIIAGNVENLQPGVLDDAGPTSDAFAYERYAEDDDDRYHLAIAEVVSLPNGMRVLVGRDQSEQVRFRGVVRSALILALALMGLAALIAWFFVGRRALRRLDGVTAASARILAGDLSERLPVTGAGDEFDRLSENLNTLLARISLLQEGLKQVSDNIAHDLRTPLTRLRSKAESALAARPTEAEAGEVLEGLIAESDQMIRTFDAILMISRVEAGSHSVLKSEIDVAEIAADVVDLYEPLAEDAGASLTLEAPPRLLVTGSRELIAQAISNLIDNALKYAAAPDRRTKIKVAISDGGTRWRLAVSDDGPGIPPDKHERVLERFYRLDQSRSMPGSGLGLSLVQAIARVHGGSLVLEDAAPGLTVVLEMPKEERQTSDGGES
ncbi:sensor histidine kinase [Jiella marina]|uniref:sensor histidine kinase n=1 Tax=Jiella sp. LLJ827 TaxID=2917712 RepID=UPI0021007C44|nr:HAMP domain-containing sensor histidine kinase [Jiella sp. LLJ827]MCQ0987616.1 HAMP domain-containing histidine kinase [Jiella sp. LLJ827]